MFARAGLLAVAAASLAAAIQITLPQHDDECFYEQVEASNKFTGSFEVMSGGMQDIDVSIIGPNGEAHYSVQRQRSGHFTIVAPYSGWYKLCFSNRMSSVSDKTVAFSTHVGDDLYREIAKQDHITPLENELTQLGDAISAVEDEQKYMWSRERQTRDTNENTNKRVLWFSIAEAAVLISMGLWQIYYLRSFFEKKRAF